MGFFPKSDAIYTFRRAGTISDPFVSYSELLQVINQRVVLKEIPDSITKVTITDLNNSSTIFIEMTNTNVSSLTGSNYLVDYAVGIVYLSADYINKYLQFSYQGTGVTVIPSSRVWTQEQNGTPTETLDNLIETSKQQISSTDSQMTTKFAQIDAEIANSQTATSNANTATTNANNAATSANNAAFLANQAYTTTLTIPKNPVSTYSAIATTYPSPSVGWQVICLDTGNQYRYDGSNWINNGNVVRGGMVVGSNQPSDTSLIWVDINS